MHSGLCMRTSRRPAPQGWANFDPFSRFFFDFNDFSLGEKEKVGKTTWPFIRPIVFFASRALPMDFANFRQFLGINSNYMYQVGL